MRRRDGLRLPFERGQRTGVASEGFRKHLDGDLPVDLAHSSGAAGCDDLIGSVLGLRGQAQRLSLDDPSILIGVHHRNANEAEARSDRQRMPSARAAEWESIERRE